MNLSNAFVVITNPGETLKPKRFNLIKWVAFPPHKACLQKALFLLLRLIKYLLT
jgi:hypothetical protein